MMTKENIKRLIKKIRTRKDYYQMQKSINTIADVLYEIVTEETGGTLQSIAEQGGNIHLTRGYNKVKFDLERTHIHLGAELNLPSSPHTSSINISPQTISLAASSKSGESTQYYMGISLGKTMFSIRDKDKELLSIIGGASPKYQFHYIENAIGDDTFTKQVVARPDGTFGIVDIKGVKRAVQREDLLVGQTTRVEDTPLELSVEAGKIYRVNGYILSSRNNSGDILLGCIERAGYEIGNVLRLRADNNTASTNRGRRLEYYGNAADFRDISNPVLFTGIIVPTRSGKIGISIQKINSNDGNGTIHKGSFLEIEEL